MASDSPLPHPFLVQDPLRARPVLVSLCSPKLLVSAFLRAFAWQGVSPPSEFTREGTNTGADFAIYFSSSSDIT